MLTIILICLHLFFTAFVFRYLRELEDEIARKNHKNKTLFPNSDDASTAKWIYPLRPYVKKWYYLGIIKPPNAERFPFSSTILVWTTDSEHFYQFIQTLCILIIAAASHLLNSLFLSMLSIGSGFALAQIAKERNPKIS